MHALQKLIVLVRYTNIRTIIRKSSIDNVGAILFTVPCRCRAMAFQYREPEMSCWEEQQEVEQDHQEYTSHWDNSVLIRIAFCSVVLPF